MLRKLGVLTVVFLLLGIGIWFSTKRGGEPRSEDAEAEPQLVERNDSHQDRKEQSAAVSQKSGPVAVPQPPRKPRGMVLDAENALQTVGLLRKLKLSEVDFDNATIQEVAQILNQTLAKPANEQKITCSADVSQASSVRVTWSATNIGLYRTLAEISRQTGCYLKVGNNTITFSDR